MDQIIPSNKEMHEFKWESVEQEKGYGNLVEWLRKRGVKYPLSSETFLVACYFIQKDHESHEWLVEMLSRMLDDIRRDILTLKQDLEQQVFR